MFLSDIGTLVQVSDQSNDLCFIFFARYMIVHKLILIYGYDVENVITVRM